MKNFMDENFLLENDTAKALYQFAKNLPIIDYHCHLDPKELYENRPFSDLAQVWLAHDHYKWRFMRWCGIPEEKTTGNADGFEKFKAFASALYLGPGNPMLHWAHLELARYFGITEVLSRTTAPKIWEEANQVIHSSAMTPQSLVEKSNVRVICTTDDPASDLKYHRLLAAEKRLCAAVLPTFRPDRFLYLQKDGFCGAIAELARTTGMQISSYADLVAALSRQLAFFVQNGCRLSDHSIEDLTYRPCTDTMANIIFEEKMMGKPITREEQQSFFTHLFLKLTKLYADYGIAMQLHIGALRNNNTRMFRSLGADTGFDSVNDFSVAEPLSRFLDTAQQQSALPKTVLYTLNPKDNIVLATMAGNFQSAEAVAKVQFGAAWWFNDHKEGIRQQLTDLANTGTLGTFIGMLTDSRSFLSYTRHEYFRRILCQYLGELAESGEYPNDNVLLQKLIKNICYQNAINYFGFEGI